MRALVHLLADHRSSTRTGQRPVWTLVLLASLASVVQGCRPSSDGGGQPGRSGNTVAQAQCSPSCATNTCGDDGCGGTCACDSDYACNAARECVGTTTCTDTCESTGFTCGEVCGELCGSDGACADTGDVCAWNQCYTPPVASSCEGCSLQLKVLAYSLDTDTDTLSATLAIDYTPAASEPNPRVLDVRLYANAPFVASAVRPGDALQNAGKELYTNPQTGNPWKNRGDGSKQMLVVSFTNTNRIQAGRILELDLSLDASQFDSSMAPYYYLPLKLLKREQTFAPLEADNAIQSTEFDTPVVVTVNGY